MIYNYIIYFYKSLYQLYMYFYRYACLSLYESLYLKLDILPTAQSYTHQYQQLDVCCCNPSQRSNYASTFCHNIPISHGTHIQSFDQGINMDR